MMEVHRSGSTGTKCAESLIIKYKSKEWGRQSDTLMLFIPGQCRNKKSRKRTFNSTHLKNVPSSVKYEVKALLRWRVGRKSCSRRCDGESAKELWAEVKLENMTLYRSSQNSFVIFNSNIQQPRCVIKERAKRMTLGRGIWFSWLILCACWIDLNAYDKVAINEKY